MAAERWATMDDLVAARERFAAAIPGWTWPALAGVGLVRPAADGDRVEFPVVNTTQHRLPVVVLAGVVGHAGGTATYPLDAATLAQAVDRLRPAAAATSVAHPNLEAWVRLQAVLAAEPDARTVAVFVADLADPVVDAYDAALRAHLASTPSAAGLDAALRALADADAAAGMARYFKAGPGGYGEGDSFLGVTVPRVKATLRPFRDLPPHELDTLLASPWHEVRTAALEIMAQQARAARTPETRRRELFDLYLRRHDRIDNWDLVDRGARDVVGRWLLAHPDGGATLDRLAASGSVWERRTAMVATMAYSDAGRVDEVLRIATLLVDDPHDLIHKAVGWLLRDVGDVEPAALLGFLDTHAATMPRTALRYALEHQSDAVRRHYLGLRARPLGR